MSKELNIALICNNRIALPLMHKLHEDGVLGAVAVTNKQADVTALFRAQAKERNIPFTVFKKKGFEEQLYDWVLEVRPDAVMVLTLPWKIPADVLAIPRLGFINYHFGLLPQMRGADPVFECIRRVIYETGATMHQIDANWDTGPIIMQEKVSFSPEMTYGMLSTQFAFIGAKMCGELVANLKNNIPITSTPQDEQMANYWPKIKEEELYINWETMDSATIKALTKACNPLAKGTPSFINNWAIGLCDVSEINLSGDASHIAPGTIIAMDPQNGLLVYCKDGKALKLDVVFTDEGYFPGYKLANFGLATGMLFTPIKKEILQ